MTADPTPVEVATKVSEITSNASQVEQLKGSCPGIIFKRLTSYSS